MSTDGKRVIIKNDNCEINPVSYDSREMLLIKLDEVIDFLHHKALNGRIVKPENEKVRIQWFKAMTYACSIYNQIKRDVELDQLKDEIEILKSQINSLEDNSSKQNLKGWRQNNES